jgi:hypothetical protein
MNANAFIDSLRYELPGGWSGSHNFSDYHITDALNKVLRLINQALCNMSSDLIKVKTDLTLTSGSANLPADFQAEIRVLAGTTILIPRTTEDSTDTSTYELYNGKLYANQSTVTLTYKKSFDELAVGATTALPVPDMFLNLLTELMKQKLAGAADSALSVYIQQEVMKLAAKRGKANSMIRPQFTI